MNRLTLFDKLKLKKALITFLNCYFVCSDFLFELVPNFGIVSLFALKESRMGEGGGSLLVNLQM